MNYTTSTNKVNIVSHFFNDNVPMFEELQKAFNDKCYQSPSQYKEERPKLEEAEQKLKFIKRALFTDNVTRIDRCGLSQADFHNYARYLANQQSILSIVDVGGTSKHLVANAKGSMSYQVKKRNKIITMTEAISSGDKDTYALTLTYDMNTFGRDKYDAWKNYQKHITAVLRPLQKQYGIHYVCVKESTSKQFPHAHIVISADRGLFSHRKLRKTRQEVKRGRLFDFIAQRVKSPVFKLERIAGKNTIFYLTKYIAKNNANYIQELAKKEDFYDEEELKYLSCMFWTSYTHSRMISTPLVKTIMNDFPNITEDTLKNLCYLVPKKKEVVQLQKQEKKIEEVPGIFDKNMEVFIKEHPIAAIPELYNKYYQYLNNENIKERLYILAGAARDHLINLCTNSPPCMRQSYYLTPRRAVEGKFTIVNEYSLGKDEEENAQINNILRPHRKNIGCRGCFFKTVVSLVLNKDFASKYHYISDGIAATRPYFAKINYNDDLQFMLELYNFITMSIDTLNNYNIKWDTAYFNSDEDLFDGLSNEEEIEKIKNMHKNEDKETLKRKAEMQTEKRRKKYIYSALYND